MTPEQRLHWKIVHRQKEGVEADIDAIVDSVTLPPAGTKPGPTRHEDRCVHTLNNVLLPAMKEVGDKFGAGELILPFVLQSAEVMKKAVAHLEKYLESRRGHDQGQGRARHRVRRRARHRQEPGQDDPDQQRLHRLRSGQASPGERSSRKAVEVNADRDRAVSALLVSTSKQMPLIVNELHRRGLKFPVLIGGAAINRRFGRRILFTEDGAPYEPGVFYCKDAFEGLDTMEQLIDPKRKPCPARTNPRRSRYGNGTRRMRHQTPNVGPFNVRTCIARAAFLRLPSTWAARRQRHAAGNGAQASQHQRALSPFVGREEYPRRGMGQAAKRIRRPPREDDNAKRSRTAGSNPRLSMATSPAKRMATS